MKRANSLVPLYFSALLVAVGILSSTALGAPALPGSNGQPTLREALRVTLSKSLLQAGIQAPIDQTRTVSDYIAGTAIQGTAWTSGNLSLDLVPSEDTAALQLRLDTQTHSDTTGNNAPRSDIDINIFSSSDTSMASWKTLYLFPTGLSASAATSNAQTNLNYNGIDVDASGLFWRLKQRRAEEEAWQQAMATKGENEQRISFQAESEMNSQLDGKTGPLIDQFNHMYQSVLYNPLFRDSGVPATLHFSSTSDSLTASVDAQVPPDAAVPPAFDGGANVLSLRIHESLLASFLSQSLNAKQFNEEDLEEYLISHAITSVLGHYHSGDPQILFHFCPDHAFLVAFQTLQIQLGLCTTQVEFRGVKSRTSAQFTATYTSRITPEGDLELWRLDDPDLGALTGFAASDLAEIQKRLARLFPEKLVVTKIQLPGKFGAQGSLVVHRADLGDGWLVSELWFDPSQKPAVPSTAGTTPPGQAGIPHGFPPGTTVTPEGTLVLPAGWDIITGQPTYIGQGN